jgi:thiamine pyrophosphokinase
MDKRVVLVVAGGPPPPAADAEAALAGLPDPVAVVAADSGLAHARTWGLRVDLVVGDMDSVDGAVLAEAEVAGTIVDRHPVAKDATDLELALERALAYRPDRVVVVGSRAGRFDHLLAEITLLAADRWASTRVEARVDGARVTVVRDATELRGQPDDLVSLLPVHGDAIGVTTEGLAYPLHAEDLPAGTSRGVSNVLLGTAATVDLASGVLLAIQPTAE